MHTLWLPVIGLNVPVAGAVRHRVAGNGAKRGARRRRVLPAGRYVEVRSWAATGPELWHRRRAPSPLIPNSVGGRVLETRVRQDNAALPAVFRAVRRPAARRLRRLLSPEADGGGRKAAARRWRDATVNFGRNILRTRDVTGNNPLSGDTSRCRSRTELPADPVPVVLARLLNAPDRSDRALSRRRRGPRSPEQARTETASPSGRPRNLACPRRGSGRHNISRSAPPPKRLYVIDLRGLTPIDT